MISLKDLEDSSFYYAVIVSKKNIPLAVNRNKIKRRIRESIIKIYSEVSLPSGSNLIIYNSKKILTFKEIKKDISFLFKKF
tara:strand:- start:254 stop:496 length:243 start_codon:yes stop_codon:yes gene_type:complete